MMLMVVVAAAAAVVAHALIKTEVPVTVVLWR